MKVIYDMIKTPENTFNVTWSLMWHLWCPRRLTDRLGLLANWQFIANSNHKIYYYIEMNIKFVITKR